MSFHSQLSGKINHQSATPSPKLTPQRFLDLFELVAPGDIRGIDNHLQRMLQRCAEWFGAAGASIFLEERGEYLLAAKSGTDSRVPEDAKISPGNGIAGSCVQSGEPMIVRDPELSPRLRELGIHRRNEIGSAMVVPLIAPESGCVGVLNLSRRPSDPGFGSEDLALARSIAVFLALAISNGRLVSRLNCALAEATLLKGRMEAVLSNTPVGILAFDRKKRLLLCNSDAGALFGSIPKQGAGWNELRGGLPNELGKAIGNALSGKALAATVRGNDSVASGSAKTWTLAAAPMPEGIVLAIQDETDFQRAQDELSRVRRLAEIGQMAAAIAHEIRNPLTGIKGAAQIIGDDPSHAAEFGAIIEAEVCKLNALCEDFLDFAKPMRIRLEECKLSAPFKHTVRMLKPAFKKAGVDLALECALGEPKILFDSRRIEQVAHNLLRNALEACGTGDSVQVQIGHRRVSVRDTGCGMSEETLKNLFVPFHTTKAGGTGLGLGNVRRILDAHRARISATSTIGQGSEFVIQFCEGGE